MSETRDTVNALRSFDVRLTSIEECLLVLVRNSEQQKEWRHEQRNEAQLDTLRREKEKSETEARDRAIKQVQEACGSISHKLAELVERLDNQSATRQSDVKELRDRVRQLELGGVPTDEITRT